MSNQHQLNKLSILPPNKTVVFYSPIEGRDVLVRTGTIGEGSCFFHSLLHAYSKEYVRLDKRGRMKLVAKLRSSLANRLDRKRWEDISNGLVAKIPFQENINDILNDFYRHVERQRAGRSKAGRNVIRAVINDDNDKQTYQVICELVPVSDFEKEILPKSYDQCSEDKIDACKKTIVDNTRKHVERVFNKLGNEIGNDRKKFCVKKIVLLVQSVVDEADNLAFKKYLDSLKDASVSVDSYTIGLISDRFNRDIYFIDARTRMPYRVDSDNNIKSRKSIIVMWVGGVHYEVVGRLLPGNRIQREFYDDDPLIKRINTYLFHPDEVSELYPSLVPYLPKDHRERLGFGSGSNSGSYESSSSNEDSDESDYSYPNSEEDSDVNSSSPTIPGLDSPSRKQKSRYSPMKNRYKKSSHNHRKKQY